MKKILDVIVLENGVEIHVYDVSKRYYGDFHKVKLEVVCEVQIREEYFDYTGEFEAARGVLGDRVVHRRIIEKMGIPTADLETVKDEILRNFKDHSLSYFSIATFPKKLIMCEMRKSTKRGARSAGGRL